MTVTQVANACAEAINMGLYMSVRDGWGWSYGYNPHLLKVSFMAKTAEENGDKESWIKSFKYISFQEYIRTKKKLFA